MTDSVQDDVIQLLADIDRTERFNFELHLETELEKAKEQGYPLTIVLLDEINKGLIYPSEQNAKSILDDVTHLFREQTKAYGPILFWAFDRIGLIQPRCDAEEARQFVEKFLLALDQEEFERENLMRKAEFVVGIADFPTSATSVADLMNVAINQLASGS